MRQLNDLRDHINATQSRDGTLASPLHGGRPWHIATAQFRRTLAWHIANQPFGTVAGMLQYQHVSVATFEGYVGESASGFRKELEAERRLAALDDLVEDYWDYVGGMATTGPGANKRNVLFARAKAALDEEGAVVDDGRLRAMLKSTARRSTPGSSTTASSTATRHCVSATRASAGTSPWLRSVSPNGGGTPSSPRGTSPTGRERSAR